MNNNRNWCVIHDSINVLAQDDKLQIVNAEHKLNVTHLQWNYRSNVMKSLPTIIFETFPNLELLDFSTGIELLNDVDLALALKLKSLILNKNKINLIKSNVFKLAVNLNDIQLDYNQITELQDNMLNGLSKLSTISLNSNFITTLTRNVFAGAPRLSSISLKNNELVSIEDGVFNLPRLTEIILSNNHLKVLPDNLFVNAPLLHHIDMFDNELVVVPQALFKQKSIDSLILDWNELENLSLNQFLLIENLNYLSLENVGLVLSSPAERVIPSKSLLTSIDLSDNNLVLPDILNQLSMFRSLEKIVLDRNLIHLINGMADIKTYFPNITSISMVGNEVDCAWLKEVLPAMKAAEIELDTGAVDENIPVVEQGEIVDGQLCGVIPLLI